MKVVKSEKYQGVFYYINKGEKVYLYRYVHKEIVNGVELKRNKKAIVGKESDGVTEKIAFLEKLKSQATISKQKKEKHLTLSQLAQKYFTAKKIYSKSMDKIQKVYNKHIKCYPIANKTIDILTRVEVREWQEMLLSKTELARGTINNLTLLIGTILNFAIENDFAGTVFSERMLPTTKCRLKNADVKRERFLSKDEIQILLDHVKNKDAMNLFVLLSINTGARYSSIMNIKKKDINFESSYINIRDTKSDNTYQVFLNHSILSILKEKNLSDMNDRLFQVNIQYFQRSMLKVLNKLFNNGLDKKDNANRVVIHTLRHTFASHLAMSGTPMRVIQKLLNHSSSKHTDRYAKLSTESGREYVIGLQF